jgi:tetratricopeptide (TPR) repeat protein
VWLTGGLLVLVTVAGYWPAMQCDFVNYDDGLYVTSNAHIQAGLTWASIRWACFSPVCCTWHPLTLLSHMLNCQMFGLKPWWHHLTNVLLHALNAGLVFALVQRMTGAPWRSLLVAALFALHPLRVESVVWVAERKDVLSAFFGLLALVFYVRYAQGRIQNAECNRQKPATPDTQHLSSVEELRRVDTPRFYVLSLLLFALGLLSKPMLVTWPFVMLLLDYWPLGRMQNAECRMQKAEVINAQNGTPAGLEVPILHLMLEKVPFFALAALMSIVTFVVQRREGALAAGEHLSLGPRLGNAVISYGRYLEKLLWPTDLAVFYPHPGQWPMGKTLLTGGVILVISVVAWVQRRRCPYLLVGWLWYCGTLAPVSQVIQTGSHALADRYTYLPALGALVAAIWGVCALARGWRYAGSALSVAGGAAIVLFLALTRQQIGYWKDSEALFRHALEVTENNQVAHNELGSALLKRGQLDEAIRQYQEAIRLKPRYAEACNNLGVALDMRGRTDEAIRQFQETIRLIPDYPVTYFNLGNALLRRGQIDEAIGQYYEGIHLKPADAGGHHNLGVALTRKGQIDDAIGQYQESIRLEPADAGAHYNLGLALAGKGQIDEAIRQYEEALKIKPDSPDTHNHLGLALATRGQIDEAICQFQEALRLKPDDSSVHNNLGATFAIKGQLDQAISQFQEVLRLKPDDAGAHRNLGLALSRKGQTSEAIAEFQEALRLKPDYADARRNLDAVLASKAGSLAAPGPSTNH